ncbi:MAG: tyrosine-protein phosphatase [Panacagrimonas sp.]
MKPSDHLLEAAPNFRDFGGYATGDGRRVRSGYLFRSELLLDLSPRDLETLATLGIGLICDLRSPAERRRLSCQWLADSPAQRLALDIDADLSAVQPDRWVRRLADPRFDAAQAHDAMLDNYRRMPASFARDLRALFEYLAAPNAGGVLVHCAAGKDRTGFVVAMLLLALGVPEDAIFADYLLTNRRYGFERLMRSRAHVLLDTELSPHAESAMHVLASVHADFLRAAFDTVLAEFADVQTYLERACELTPARCAALHAALLET